MNIGYHEKMLELVDLLVPCLPGKLDTLFFSTTGAEAVENAVKVARCFTGKHAVVSCCIFDFLLLWRFCSEVFRVGDYLLVVSFDVYVSIFICYLQTTGCL